MAARTGLKGGDLACAVSGAVTSLASSAKHWMGRKRKQESETEEARPAEGPPVFLKLRLQLPLTWRLWAPGGPCWSHQSGSAGRETCQTTSRVHSWNPLGGQQEPTPEGCSLPSTEELWYTHTHNQSLTHSINKCNLKDLGASEMAPWIKTPLTEAGPTR